jgi:serine/threonine protein kinase
MKYCATCKLIYPADFQCCPKDGSPLRSGSELLPGMVIRDKYQILEKIGSGGMATVYQVRHLAFNEILAIKLINSQLADGDFDKRLRSEAVIARKLRHPNAVHVEDLDRTEDGRPFIVMEYVEGQNLRTIIRQKGPLPTLRALRIAAQVVSALGAAHKLGIIHRDIKPDNIHLISQSDGSDFVKVLDFGIAKLTQGTSSSNAPLTGSGLVVGTPQYVSPEQAMGRQARELDGRSDLYTLGIVLYEMLTGKVPFDSDTPVGLLVHHLHTMPVPPDELRPDLGIPHSLSELLMKALQKNPDQRFHDADDMLSAITAVEEQVRRVQNREIVLNKPEKNPELHFPDADTIGKETVYVEEPDWRFHENKTDVPRTEVDFPATKPLNVEPVSSAIQVPSEESPSLDDSTMNEVAPPTLSPPGPSINRMWPLERPSLRDATERYSDLYEPSTSGRTVYAGIAAFAIVCLGAIGIYQWRSTSQQPTLELRNQNPSAAKPISGPAAAPGESSSSSGTQESSIEPNSTLAPATRPPASPTNSAPAANSPKSPENSGPTANPSSTTPASPAEQERINRIKSFVAQGRTFSDGGDYTSAIEMFDSALKLDSQSAEAKAGKRRAKERMQLEQALPNEAK